jgi:hypothetical protein
MDGAVRRYDRKPLVSVTIGLGDRVILFLYGAYFVLTPFYWWSSGLPQVADILLVITMAAYVIKNRLKVPVGLGAYRFVGVGLIFILWVMITNLRWTFQLQMAETFLDAILFYLYNFMVAALTVSLAAKYKKVLLHTVFKAVAISVTIQFLIFMSAGGFVGGRARGTFNNPNQLGYYAIIVSCLLMFLNNEIKVKSRTLILSLLFSAILVLASLSNGAIISWFVLYFFFLLSKSNNKKTKRRIFVFTLMLILLTAYIYHTSTIIQDNSFYQSLDQRLSQTRDKIETSSEGRGYDRITGHPEYWLFGAGEGVNERFGYNMELHSTLGNIQLSYGVIGTLLFLGFLLIALKRNRFNMWYGIMAIMLYGFSHNGIRNSLLWILLGLMAGTVKSSKRKRIDGV